MAYELRRTGPRKVEIVFNGDDTLRFYATWDQSNCTPRYRYDDDTLIIPEGIKKLEYGSMFDDLFEHPVWGSCRSIYLPDSLVYLPRDFLTSSRHTRMVSTGATKIGSHSFRECRELQSVHFRNPINEIPTGAFSGCGNLKNVTGLESTKIIGAGAFRKCPSLEFDFSAVPSDIRVGPRAFKDTPAPPILLADLAGNEYDVTNWNACTTLAEFKQLAAGQHPDSAISSPATWEVAAPSFGNTAPIMTNREFELFVELWADEYGLLPLALLFGSPWFVTYDVDKDPGAGGSAAPFVDMAST